MSGISHLKLTEVPVAVVDMETTGLHPRGDRIIEIAIVRVDPGQDPRLVLDTLVNPQRRVSATDIHGITDRDVADAPTFDEIAPDVGVLLSGCVFASFNVYFDARFLSNELERSAISPFPPHLCLMYLRPGLGLGPRCTLRDACIAHNVRHERAHCAADDALASAQLWRGYLRVLNELNIPTFGALGKRLSYKFVQSFQEPLLNVVAVGNGRTRLKSRRQERSDAPATVGSDQPAAQNPFAEYWEALKSSLADLSITNAEINYLAHKRKQLRLTDAQVRWLHARAFSGVLAQFSDDHAIDDVEVSKLAALAGGLRTLGWSPGDPIT